MDEPGKNFSLSHAEFTALAERLKEGDQQLIREIFATTFVPVRTSLRRDYGVKQAVAHDACVDALIQLRDGIARGTIGYGNLLALYRRMAGQHLGRLQSDKGSDNLPLSALSANESNVLARDVRLTPNDYQRLDVAFRKLGARCRELLLQVYRFGVNMTVLSARQDELAATLRQRKRRCLEQLRQLYLDK